MTNFNIDSTSGPIRIDLTSQDLRTGTLRLPARLQEWFAEGSLVAYDTETDKNVPLELVAPRDLHGLGEFFQEHELKANDAVLLYPGHGSLRIEPFQRRRERPSEQPAATEPAAIQSVSSFRSMPAAVPAPEAEPAAEPTAEPTPAAPVTELEPSPPQEVAATPEPEPVITEALLADDPFSQFSAFDDEETDDSFDFHLVPEAAPAEPTEMAPKVDVAPDQPETDEPAHPAPPRPIASTGSWHSVARRGFGPPHRPGPVVLAPPLLPGSGHRALAAEQAEQELMAAHEPEWEEPNMERPADRQPNIRQEPLWQEVNRSPASQVAGYLARPDLPTIIQASVVAGELGLALEDVAEAMSQQAGQPDSKISKVRENFFMLRRSSD